MAGIAQRDCAKRDAEGVLRDTAIGSGPAQFGVLQAVAPSLRVEVSPINMRDPREIKHAVAAFAHSPNNGLIVPASASAAVHRTLIITLAAHHKLPAVYFGRDFVAAGGLVSYGLNMSTNSVEGRLRRPHPQGREAGGPAGTGADQVRTGDQPQDSQALGLEMPPTLLARADEVIE